MKRGNINIFLAGFNCMIMVIVIAIIRSDYGCEKTNVKPTPINKNLIVYICKKSDVKPKFNDESVKAGQVWIYRLNTGNPFKNEKVYIRHVINVQNGYVQYKINNMVRSDKISWFKIGAERIK